ncbi:MAG: hypothetical protein A2452_01550 [Candidatus Firestonebacteria bacterium RIFOXYC2_FULL_39_67]|nr:MAG: hypothetical protein A2536_05785 [Candidatus Firestonebacteria bacterium RIFOXYD2_FULL_39_29]OGF54197.1 MAG: hypothetical protein A2452_01550 [Candidatus Firestonebacteria bacterium RIFOXYC2_FULL_39_67]OGF57677.1 MAG: hypothetical protein A2497_03510 [Candidatus Firestonebacteria bacterium RifOxyC12_full_39_7]
MAKKKEQDKWHHHNGASGGIYGLAFIGALIYFMQRADSFWTVILGILKAIIWPVLVVYNLLKYLNM